jgi:pimeloyl-ACP methyl ester carboxylesterase
MADDGVFVTLRDGRNLAYAEYGRRRGSPAFYFHGTPGGLLEGRLLDEAARLQDVRLIAVDRPGYGSSDFKKDRRITDWPGDVADLADALEIDRFGVVGLSGGGPHVQACAAAMPERVTTAVIVSGAGSPEAAVDGRGRVARVFIKAMLVMTPILAWFAAIWAAFWAPHTRQWMMPRSIDRALMKRRAVREAYAEEVRDALRPGEERRLRTWCCSPGRGGSRRVTSARCRCGCGMETRTRSCRYRSGGTSRVRSPAVGRRSLRVAGI